MFLNVKIKHKDSNPYSLENIKVRTSPKAKSSKYFAYKIPS